MIKLLIASRTSEHWTLVALPRLRANGTGPVPKKIQGTHYSAVARVAAIEFAKCAALEDMDFQFGSEQVRVSRRRSPQEGS